MIKQTISHSSLKIKKSTLMLFIFVIISICFFIFELYLIEEAIWRPERNERNNITAQGLRIQINQLKKKVNQFKNTPITKTLSDNLPLKIPQSVNLLLATFVQSYASYSPLSVKHQRIPVFVLSTIVSGSGCDSASALQTKSKYDVANNLVIDILGYNFNKSKEDNCISVIVESRKEIPIDLNWLKSGEEKEIVFNLNQKSNRYKIYHNNYKISLVSINASNVISTYPSENPSTPKDMEVVLYPIDTAVLYLAGFFDSKKDYRPLLIQFAKTQGFAPIEEVYPEIAQTDKTQLYISAENHSLPELNHGQFLGELINSRGTNVYLKRYDQDLPRLGQF